MSSGLDERFRRSLLPGCLAAVLLALSAADDGYGAGATIITHGWAPLFGGPVPWIEALRDDIAETRLGGEQVYGTLSAFRLGPWLQSMCRPWDYDVEGSQTGEILITLHWFTVADHTASYLPAQEIAKATVPRLLEPQHGKPALAELPLHLIGHSRGSSLVCELARRLGERGVVVHHLTLLDPHPLTKKDPQPMFRPPVIDTPVAVYDNVLFADAYSQMADSLAGQYVPGAYNRLWTELPHGYHDNDSPDDANAGHRNVCLLYHGTVRLKDPVENREATLGAEERAAWFNPYEQRGARTGYAYSRLGGENRHSADTPAGQDRIDEGYHSDAALGGRGVRRPLRVADGGAWPNLVELRVSMDGARLGPEPQTVPRGAVLEIEYVVRDGDSDATVTVYTDGDRNPYNRGAGPEVARADHTRPTAFTRHTVTWDTAEAPAGPVYLQGRVTDGEHTRYLYAAPALRFE